MRTISLLIALAACDTEAGMTETVVDPAARLEFCDYESYGMAGDNWMVNIWSRAVERAQSDTSISFPEI